MMRIAGRCSLGLLSILIAVSGCSSIESPCDLVTRGQVQNAVGLNVVDEREYRGDQCHWWLDGYSDPAVVLVLLENVQAWREQGAVAIPGIGDAAWWHPGRSMLLVRSRDIAFMVRIDGVYEYITGRLDGLEATGAIAKHVVERLHR